MNGTRFGCINCPPGRYLWENQCLLECPPGSYTGIGVCHACESPCETCVSITSCLTCRQSFYQIQRTDICVLGKDCPMGTYPEDSVRMCKVCFYSCLTCKGPTKDDCIICNYAKGFGRSKSEVGECYMLLCMDGMFLKIDYEANKASCDSCDSSCRTCDDASPDSCIECMKGLRSFSSGIPNRLTCKTCAQYSAGVFTNSQGECQGKSDE